MGGAAFLGIVLLAGMALLPIWILVTVRRIARRMIDLESAVLDCRRALIRMRTPDRSSDASPIKPLEASPAASAVPPAPEKTAVSVSPVSSPDVTASHTEPTAVSVQSSPPPLSPKPIPAVLPANLRMPVEPPDTAAARLLRRMWNWIVVGEEFRRPGLSAEFAIATTWLIRAGVLIALFAVGFGLQLSIARGLLGPAGRVSITLVCGVGFLALGLRCMARHYPVLGQGFVGGGLAMFYFAFYAASVMFRLMPVAGAFACMAAVTASAVVLAVRLEALSVAVLGALGGYLTPIMLKTPHPDYAVFYAYLAVLAVGMAVVAVRRQWPLLTWISLVLNSLLFLGAAGGRCAWEAGQGSVQEIFYLCGFFALYSTAIFAYAVRNRVPATLVELAALFLNALVTAGGGALLLGQGPLQKWRLAVLAVGVAAFYVAHIWWFLLRRGTDRVLLSGFIALAVIFLGATPPLLFTGEVLSTVFALQAVALLWGGRRLDSRIMTVGAVCLYGMVMLRLVAGLLCGAALVRADSTTYLVGLKDRVAEFVIPILALFAGWRLFRTPPAAARHGVGDASMRDADAFRGVLMVFVGAFYLGCVAYVTCELVSFFRVFLPSVRMAAVTVAWAVFAFHLMACKSRLSDHAFQLLLRMAVALVCAQWLVWGWLFARSPVVDELRHAAAFSLTTALPRLIATGACLAVLIGAWSALRRGSETDLAFRRFLLTAALVAGFLYLTFEVATCCTAYVPGFRASAVSVIWGCYAFGLLVGGLRWGQRVFRMAGLGLFSVTIGKIFLSDLAGLDVMYRLVAFGVLSGVLLLAAYAYLRNQAQFNQAADGQRGDA